MGYAASASLQKHREIQGTASATPRCCFKLATPLGSHGRLGTHLHSSMTERRRGRTACLCRAQTLVLRLKGLCPLSFSFFFLHQQKTSILTLSSCFMAEPELRRTPCPCSHFLLLLDISATCGPIDPPFLPETPVSRLPHPSHLLLHL